MFELETSSTEDAFSLRDEPSQPGGHDGRTQCGQKSPRCPCFQELLTADVPPWQGGCVRPRSGTAERRAVAGGFSPPSSNSRPFSAKARSLKMESVSSRRRTGCVRQENACLSMRDEPISDFDAVQYELASFRSQVGLRGPTVGVKSNAAVMSEQIHQLQAELEAQAKELKAAELRAECSQEAAAHSDIVVATLTEELNELREELGSKTALGKRAEQQRNQALQNAEKLKEAFKDYKATISMKFEKVMKNESKLKESLAGCDREKEELEKKCSVLEREKSEQSQTISQLKEQVRQADAAAAGLRAQVEEAGRKAVHLDRQLAERAEEWREVAALRKQLEDLRTVSQSQEQRAAQSHREAEQSLAELSSLEAILALLHLREGSLGPLCVRPCVLPRVDYSGTAHLLNLKPGEGYQQLLRVFQSIEAERTKLSGLVEQLQERLSRSQEEISSLQSSMAQRASHYQSLHTELLDKVSQAADTEKELKRKSARAASLEKQLQEKTSAYSQAALTNTELENQLQEKNSAIQHYQSLMTKKQREYQQSLENCKKANAQQFTEQQHRIEMLQLSVEEAQSRLLDMETEVSSLLRERDDAQKVAVMLQSSVDQLMQEKEAEAIQNEELLQSFKEQAALSATKVCELQASLSVCREDLDSHLQRMEEVKKSYESELQKSSDKVSGLQEKLRSANLVCQSSSEQHLQLQDSLQQQQTMLTESAAHICELEESQSLLQTQVSSLEHQLESTRATLQEELRAREQEAQEKDKDLQSMNQQNTQLSESVSHLTSEMTKCRGELQTKETELQRLRRDVTAKTSQMSRMEESLLYMTRQLESKSDMVVDLEEQLHRCEADKLNCAQRVQILEGQLQAVRGELADTLEQLQELRDVLQRTQTTADEQQATVEKLTVQLSETQRELEDRTHEVLDMDTALKERQGELQQRADLLGQLDVAIREHKREMERRVESVQQSLEARESELREAQRQLADRNVKESQELSQQLHVCQQKLQTSLQELEDSQHLCEALTRELEATKLLIREREVQLCRVEEELAVKEARWLQLEDELHSTVSSLELELQQEREQYSKELESLQQTRGQLLKVSEQMSSTMRLSQDQLTAKLQQSQSQLEQAEARCDRVQTQLEHTQTELHHTRKQLADLQAQRDQAQSHLEQLSAQLDQTRAQALQLQTESSESLLLKDSEVTRLQTRISSLVRAADLYSHTLSLPALHSLTPSPPSSPQKHQTAASSSTQTHSTLLPSPTHTQAFSSPPAHTHRRPSPTPPNLCNRTSSSQACDWLQSLSSDSSLDLPPSLKATLKEALSKQTWESSSSSSSSFPDTEDHSWQGLSTVEATAVSDLSFNPLTYMVEKEGDQTVNMDATLTQEGEPTSESRRESVCTLVAEEEGEDMNSLTGMLRFVNQTLAMQEDPSLWSSTGLKGHSLTLQRDVKET